MADVKVGYVRGKLSKKGRAIKSERMRKLNAKKHDDTEISDCDHSYHRCDQRIELDNAGAHLEIDSTLSAKPGTYFGPILI